MSPEMNPELRALLSKWSDELALEWCTFGMTADKLRVGDLLLVDDELLRILEIHGQDPYAGAWLFELEGERNVAISGSVWVRACPVGLRGNAI